MPSSSESEDKVSTILSDYGVTGIILLVVCLGFVFFGVSGTLGGTKPTSVSSMSTGASCGMHIDGLFSADLHKKPQVRAYHGPAFSKLSSHPSVQIWTPVDPR